MKKEKEKEKELFWEYFLKSNYYENFTLIDCPWGFIYLFILILGFFVSFE